MNNTVSIGILGDFDEQKPSHRATNSSLAGIERELEITVEHPWIPSTSISKNCTELEEFSGLWAGPGDYHSSENVLLAIQHARENNIPFLGT